jgi:hypothetical protein
MEPKLCFTNIQLYPSKRSFGGVKSKSQTHETQWPPLLYTPLLGAGLIFH